MSKFSVKITIDLFEYAHELSYEKYKDREPDLYESFMDQFSLWQEEFEQRGERIYFPNNVNKEKYPEFALVLEHVKEDFEKEFHKKDIRNLILEIEDYW